mmetsp:Transcript_20740/g.23062  ORF Transcript_20740/g.23062 Transcript_20740/m.23062 type:complete len:329 (-) Transcript_20740:89-1075(-)
MQRLLLLALAFAVLAFAAHGNDYKRQFTRWVRTHGKTYSATEYRPRFKVWKRNAKFIERHNADETKTHKVAMNHLGDLSSLEFRSVYLGFNGNTKSGVSVTSERDAAVPDTWDWRPKGAVTPIKNQGQCGSCWSFSAAESTEGCHFLDTGKLVGLSEQNLMDCSQSYGNQGCNGGLMDQAFEYIIKNGGIDTESSYPYQTESTFDCRYKAANCGSTVTSYKDVPSGDENSLMSFVYAAPTSVAIDASHQSFQFYSSGVYYEPECSSSQLDHGVLAVGYGASGSSDYWIVKNSWGAGWGDSGYIMMSRNRNNNCGIATSASRPLGCKDC